MDTIYWTYSICCVQKNMIAWSVLWQYCSLTSTAAIVSSSGLNFVQWRIQEVTKVLVEDPLCQLRGSRKHHRSSGGKRRDPWEFGSTWPWDPLDALMRRLLHFRITFIYTLCPRSIYQFYIVTCHIKCVITSWTYSTILILLIFFF